MIIENSPKHYSQEFIILSTESSVFKEQRLGLINTNQQFSITSGGINLIKEELDSVCLYRLY